jgi:chemotaxis protein methyltransferase CheR
MEVTSITDEEVYSLTQSIFIRYGIDFTCYEPKSLRRRIIRVLNVMNFNSIHELWVKFLRDPTFVYDFMNEVSVGMTSMFRDPILWRSLKEHIPTDFKSREELSIWHCGCSTGEEVYTMGIVLSEMKLLGKAKALATDINQNALHEGEAGVYHKIKMFENENNFKEYDPFSELTRYCSRQEEYTTLDHQLIEHVAFKYHNVITDPFPRDFDIIFCRNVMIYFDASAKMKLLDKFYDSLKPGGYFIIGFFDAMGHMMDQNQFVLMDEKAKIFKKK